MGTKWLTVISHGNYLKKKNNVWWINIFFRVENVALDILCTFALKSWKLDFGGRWRFLCLS